MAFGFVEIAEVEFGIREPLDWGPGASAFRRNVKCFMIR